MNLDTEYKIRNKTRQVKNKECAACSCKSLATRKIVFELGFSAGFCDTCSDDLITKKIGRVEDTHIISLLLESEVSKGLNIESSSAAGLIEEKCSSKGDLIVDG